MNPLDPENTVELIFMIEVHNDYKKYFGRIKNCLIQNGLNDYVKTFRAELPETVSVYGPRDNHEDPWRQLVIRETLSNVIQGRKTAQEQVDSIYHRLKHWCNLVFDDCKVEEIFEYCFEHSEAALEFKNGEKRRGARVSNQNRSKIVSSSN